MNIIYLAQLIRQNTWLLPHFLDLTGQYRSYLLCNMLRWSCLNTFFYPTQSRLAPCCHDFFLQYYVSKKVGFFFHPTGCPYFQKKRQMDCVVPLLRSWTQHDGWWEYWILLSLWICICTWCLGFLSVTYPLQFYVNPLSGKDRVFTPSIQSLEAMFPFWG